MTLSALLVASQLTLTWTNHAPDQTGIVIERATGVNGAYAERVRLPGTPIRYVDLALPKHITYCYRVRAYRVADLSDPSSAVCRQTR